MSVLSQRVFLGACVFALSACSMLDREQNAGTFSSDNVLHVTMPAMLSKPETKSAAVLRITPYMDQRAQKDHRLLGELAVRVFGLSGNQLLIDQDVAGVVTNSLKRQFVKNGFEVQEGGATSAPTFELSGTIKELTLNSKDRDDISIAVETSVKDVASGKVIWTALVTEKNNRFAGVSGNTKGDLVDYLNREVRVVSDKTVDGVNTLLMATYPALFNLTPGTKTIAGVKVLTAPLVVPVPTPAPIAVPTAAEVAPATSAMTGVLLVSSLPSRAKVYVDEVYYGLTPLHLDLDAGVHGVTIKQSGYKNATEKVSVRKGEQTELELQLEK